MKCHPAVLQDCWDEGGTLIFGGLTGLPCLGLLHFTLPFGALPGLCTPGERKVSSGIHMHIQKSHFLFGKGSGSSKALVYSLCAKAMDKGPIQA